MAKSSVTSTLLIMNVLIFGMMLLQGVDPMRPATESLLQWGANYGPRTTQSEPWRLLTSMFLHIGVLHLLFNMVALWNVGRLLEGLIGSPGFVVLYLLSGLAGSLASVLWNPQVVSAGASGAIFGLFGGLLAFLVRHREAASHGFLAALRTNTLAFLGYNLLFGMLQEGIDMAAHLGGLVGGGLCGIMLTHPLTLASGVRRCLRSLLVGGIGLGLVGFAITMLPPVEDVEAALQHFSTLDQHSLHTFQEALTQLQDRKLSEAGLARLLEHELLPPWREQRDAFLKLTERRLPKRQSQLLSTLVTYMNTRQEGWELLHAGLLKHDQRLLNQGVEKQRQASQILEQLTQPSKKRGR